MYECIQGINLQNKHTTQDLKWPELKEAILPVKEETKS